MKNHNQYNGGIADVWYSGSKNDLWVEYKFIALPKRDDTVIDLIGGKNPALSHLQQQWLKARHTEGRSVGVIVGSKDGGVWLPGVTWDITYSGKAFRSGIIPRADLASLISTLTHAC